MKLEFPSRLLEEGLLFRMVPKRIGDMEQPKVKKRGEEEELMQMKAGKGKFIIAIISQRQGGNRGERGEAPGGVGEGGGI